MASVDEYWAKLDDGSTGGVYGQLGVTHHRAAGVRLTSAASGDPVGVETRIVDTPLVICLSAVCDR